MQKSLKSKLAAGDLCLGSWLSLAHPGIAEIMVRAGFDWVCLDMEHSSITFAEAEELIRVIDLGGATPLVRVTNNDPQIIKRVLDSGARGIVVPMVCSGEEAKAIVDAAYYPPKGKRGVGLQRANHYGADFQGYRASLEQNLSLIVQIEHVDAIPHLDAIFSTPGIDAYMIGPYDLTSSMGIAGEFTHPEFLKKLALIQECARKHKLPQGIHIVEPDTQELSKKIKEGYRFIAYGVDFRMLDQACRAGVRVAQERK